MTRLECDVLLGRSGEVALGALIVQLDLPEVYFALTTTLNEGTEVLVSVRDDRATAWLQWFEFLRVFSLNCGGS